MNHKKYLLYPVQIPVLFLSMLVLCAGVGVILGFKRCKRHFVFHEILHPIRDAYQRTPSLSYILKSSPEEIADYVTQLNKNGIVHIKSFLTAEEFAEMKNDFEGFVGHIQANAANVDDEGAGFTEDFFSKKENAYYSTNPFKYSKQLVKSCCNKKLTSIINHYFKADTYIYRAGAARILPIDSTGYGSFQWHHDAWGKSVNVMFLLSDVGDGDQAMTYVMGSHNIRHSFEKFMRSRLSLDYCKERMTTTPIFTCKGKAGDLFIFDTNGVHSGNRTAGRARDTFIISYSTGKNHIWRFPFDHAKAIQYTENGYNPFAKVIAECKKDPKAPMFPEIRSWVDGVLQINTWI